MDDEARETPVPESNALGDSAPTEPVAPIGLPPIPPKLPPAPPPPPDPLQSLQQLKPAPLFFRFPCPVCDIFLEADANDHGRPTTCPTCGQNFPIPLLDRNGRVMFDPTRTPKKPKESQAYLHAYAASGRFAPQIVHLPDGRRAIGCSRCAFVNPPTADWCQRCRMPFAVETGTRPAVGNAGPPGTAVAGLVLSLCSVLFNCLFGIPSILGLVFGITALVSLKKPGSNGAGKGMAWAAVIISGLTGLGWLSLWLKVWRW